MALHEPALGGATRALLRALPLLEQRGWTFSFWVPGRGPAAEELRAMGRPVAGAERPLRFSLGGLREPPGPARRLAGVPGYLRAWRSWLRAQEAALVHANSLLALPELASRPRGSPPAVLHAHEVLEPGPRGRAAALLARRADLVLAVSEGAARSFRPCGIEPEVVYEAVPDPGPLPPRAEAGGRPVVGTIATVCRRKGSDVFLAAVRELQREGRQVEFRMVGEPALGREQAWGVELLADARARGVVARSRVEPFAELAEWDVFALPSRMDPCPLAVLEAMASGVPVVGTHVGGIPEQLGDDAGLLVPSEDPLALAGAIGRLLDSPSLRASLGAAARRRAARLFSLERQAAALDSAYRRMLAGVPRAASPARSA